MFNILLAHPHIVIWTTLILFFERAMYCGYVVDDDVWCSVMRKHKKDYHDKKMPLYRLLKHSTYGAGIFKNAIQEHLFTVILHGAICSLIYHISGSLLAAMLYLLNPINNQTTLWLNGRRYALTVLFVLIAWGFPLTAPAMAVLCANVHISGVLFPVLFMWSPYWILSVFGSAIMAIFGLPGFLKIAKSRKSQFKNGNENHKITCKKLILYVKTVGYQFVNCVFPNKPAMYHNFLFYFSQTEEGTKEGYSLNFDFWKGIAVCGALGYLIIFQHSFWAFWFLVFISPWCNLYQITMTASDRYCSLPNIGAMCLLAGWLIKLPDPIRTAAISAIAAFYAIKYRPLFFAYRNVINFYNYHINQQPDIINPRFFLSKIYIAKKDVFQAYSIIRQGMRYRPYDFKLLLGFIECLFTLGKPTSALRAMEVCEKHVPPLEVADTENLFAGIRKQYRKEYEALQKSKDEVDRMNSDQLYDEKVKIKNNTSALTASQRKKVISICNKVSRLTN